MVIVQLPISNKCCVLENEILILRYYPNGPYQLYWDAVPKLEGYSVFVGNNNDV